MPVKPRRHRPLYPLLAAVALGGALASGCGVGDETTAQDRQTITTQQVDAGPQSQQPQPPEFMGGGAPYEALDGGQP